MRLTQMQVSGEAICCLISYFLQQALDWEARPGNMHIGAAPPPPFLLPSLLEYGQGKAEKLVPLDSLLVDVSLHLEP